MSLTVHFLPFDLDMPNVRNIPNSLQACISCRTRKVKCDSQTPCSNCISHKKECFYTPSQRGKRTRLKRKIPFEDRLAKIEALMHVSSFDDAQCSSTISPDTTSHRSPYQLRDRTLNIVSRSLQSEQVCQSSFSDVHTQAIEEVFTAKSLPQIQTSIGLFAETPPVDTPQSWDVVPTTRSIVSLDDRNRIKQGDQGNKDESSFPTQTQIWEHHGKTSFLLFTLSST